MVAAKKVVTDLPPNIDSTDVPASESPFATNGHGTDGFVAGPNDFPSIELPDQPKSKPDTELILKALLSTYTTIGMGVTLVSMPDGMRIIQNAETLTESWRQILDNDTKLRRLMKKLIQGSGWGAVIAAHIAVAIPIINNHTDGFGHLFSGRQATPQSE